MCAGAKIHQKFLPDCSQEEWGVTQAKSMTLHLHAHAPRPARQWPWPQRNSECRGSRTELRGPLRSSLTPSFWSSTVPLRCVLPGLAKAGVPSSHQKPVPRCRTPGLTLCGHSSLERAQGRAAKEHFNPSSELCQGLSCAPLRGNCERSRGVGGKNGACCPGLGGKMEPSVLSFLPCYSGHICTGWSSSVRFSRGKVALCGVPQ